MFNFTGRLYLATAATDLRRGFSLQVLIQHQLGFAQPLNGDVFGFINKGRNLAKLFWFAEGAVHVCAIRLPVGTFRWPQAGEKTVALTPAQLHLLLSGIDLTETRARKRWRREPATTRADGPS